VLVNDKRKALALAGVLTATVLTGGAAILGMTHSSTPAAAAPAAVVQTMQTSAPQHWEEAD
jgi:hypothetical protein